jgi:hypothetical protein
MTYTNSTYGLSIAHPPITMELLGSGKNVGKDLGPVPLCNAEFLSATYFPGINPHLP